MKTYPIQDAEGTVFAFEIDAQLIAGRLARVLRQTEGVTDVRPRRGWVGSPDIHIRFRYLGREYVVWEPFGDNSRWCIAPDDDDAPHQPIEELERAVAAG